MSTEKEKEKEKEKDVFEAPLKQRWLQMGVELEGSWTSKSRSDVAAQVRGAKAVKDLSVKIGVGDPGEIITRPHADLDALCTDILALYPDQVHVSCGFHAHNSFTPMDASIIASHKFYSYFKDCWEKWGHKKKLPRTHEFWTRLHGQNVNARDEFVPEKQLIGDGRGGKGSHARYTILNFYSWELHRTVECRLLPMFSDRELAVDAIRYLAWIYDSYLNRNGFESISFEPKSQLQGERVLESYEMKIPDTTPMSYTAEGQFPRLEMGDDVFYAIPGATDDMLPFKPDTGKQTP